MTAGPGHALLHSRTAYITEFREAVPHKSPKLAGSSKTGRFHTQRKLLGETCILEGRAERLDEGGRVGVRPPGPVDAGGVAALQHVVGLPREAAVPAPARALLMKTVCIRDEKSSESSRFLPGCAPATIVCDNVYNVR